MLRWQVFVALAALAMGVAGCGSPMTVDGVTVLRHGITNGGPAALLTGTVHFRDGCVWADAFGESQVVVWPWSARLDHADGELVIVVDDVTLRDGDQFSIGGGQFTDVAFIRGLAGSIPDACLASLYWLGGEVSPG